jgi:hypothetical protein
MLWRGPVEADSVLLDCKEYLVGLSLGTDVHVTYNTFYLP